TDVRIRRRKEHRTLALHGHEVFFENQGHGAFRVDPAIDDLLAQRAHAIVSSVTVVIERAWPSLAGQPSCMRKRLIANGNGAPPSAARRMLGPNHTPSSARSRPMTAYS